VGLVDIELIATVDLVGQASGGPDEDPADGCPFRAGRRTYDVFATVSSVRQLSSPDRPTTWRDSARSTSS
jgi:hypothetical protein